jgi:hypothetical protein
VRFMRLTSKLIAWVFFCTLACPCSAELKSERFLPGNTEAAVLVPDVYKLQSHLDDTKLGELFRQGEVSDALQGIAAQLRDKLKLDTVDFDPDTVTDVAAGELAVAWNRPAENEMGATLLIDATDRTDGAEELIDKAIKRLTARGATVQPDGNEGDVKIRMVALKKEAGIGKQRMVYYSIAKQWLVIGDSLSMHRDVLQRIAEDGKKAESFAENSEYKNIKTRLEKADSSVPDIVWYVNPFALAETIQTQTKRKVDQVEYVAILRKHGFDAIKCMGGDIRLGQNGRDAQTHTFIYAPDVAQKKVTGAARALDISNTENISLMPQDWIPSGAATYLSFAYDAKRAFAYLTPMIDDIIGTPDTVKNALEAIKTHNNGAKVDIQTEILDHLGKRLTIVSDTKPEVDLKSELLLATIEIGGDEAIVRSALNRIFEMMEKRGEATPHQHHGINFWERTPETKTNDDDSGDVQIDIVGLPEEAEDKNKVASEPLVSSQVIAVVDRRIIVTNNVDFMKSTIDAIKTTPAQKLAEQEDFKQINEELAKLSPGVSSMRRFGRLDRIYRAAYELGRKGELAESDSLLTNFINGLLDPEERDRVRKQSIDISQLPADYEKSIAPFLGFYGFDMQYDDGGVFVTGVLLPKK